MVSVFVNQNRGDYYAVEETMADIGDAVVAEWSHGAEPPRWGLRHTGDLGPPTIIVREMTEADMAAVASVEAGGYPDLGVVGMLEGVHGLGEVSSHTVIDIYT